MTKLWRLEYVEDTMISVSGNQVNRSFGYYKLSFNDCLYGTFGKDSLDKKSTYEILCMVETMLNDAYTMVLRRPDY